MMMENIEIKESINYKNKISELKLDFPEGVVLLPNSIDSATDASQLMFDAEYDTVQKLLKSKGIEVNALSKDGGFPKIVNQSFEWAGPLILFTSKLISENPEIITTTISTITNYLINKLRGVPKGDNSVNLKITTETQSGKFKKIEYKGPVEGMKDLADVVKSVHEEND